MARARTVHRATARREPLADLTTAARLWGALAGIGGLVHGVGEVLQGNVATTSIFLPSWTTGPIADNLGGEPGVTLVPNLLVTGILTIAVALTLVFVASRPVRGRGHGLALLALSTTMLLVGGGVGPPVIGLCAGAASLASRRPATSAISPRADTLWRWLFWLALATTIFLVFGSLFAAYVLDLDIADAFMTAFLASVVVLPATIFAGARAGAQGGMP